MFYSTRQDKTRLNTRLQYKYLFEQIRPGEFQSRFSVFDSVRKTRKLKTINRRRRFGPDPREILRLLRFGTRIYQRKESRCLARRQQQ